MRCTAIAQRTNQRPTLFSLGVALPFAGDKADQVLPYPPPALPPKSCTYRLATDGSRIAMDCPSPWASIGNSSQVLVPLPETKSVAWGLLREQFLLVRCALLHVRPPEHTAASPCPSLHTMRGLPGRGGVLAQGCVPACPAVRHAKAAVATHQHP